MKKWITALLFAGIILSMASAQDRTNKVNFGFGLTDSQGNFGLELEASSPRFLGDIFMIRARGGWEYASADLFAGTNDHWTNFASARLGLIAGGEPVAGAVRPYGEFGMLAVFAGDLTGKEFVPGIYGLFGLEFYTDEMLKESPVAYYVELGSSGIDLETNDTTPLSFYNGFKVAAGVRFYL